MYSTVRQVRIMSFVYAIVCVTTVSASPLKDESRTASFFQNYLNGFLSTSSTANDLPFSQGADSLGRQRSALAHHVHFRRPLSDSGDDEDIDERDGEVAVRGMSVTQLRGRITGHQVKLARLKQEARDLAHERAFLEKTLELKKGQRTMQDGQNKLNKAELAEKAREIEMYKREAPRTVAKYNALLRKQKVLQETLNKLHQESEVLSTSRSVIMGKIQNLNMEDLIERHARSLPDAMAGALRKSAAALTPFFDYLMIAADTNNRLVDHVGAEIDKYTHVNIAKSPFMSGVLFYCVVLIPLLTVVSFVRRLFDNSSKLTVSHYIIFGNLYFVVICLANIVATLVLREDPVSLLFRKFEKTFIIGNLILSTYYAWHLIMLGLQVLYTFEKRNLAQFVATLSVGIHYFLFAWRRIFTDNAPLMYSVNYLMYGTIFCFILYERYNRMSFKQLNESGFFKLVQIALKQRRRVSTIRSVKSLISDLKTAISPSQIFSQRRFQKREERLQSGDQTKSRTKATERIKPKSKVSYLSEGSDSDTSGRDTMDIISSSTKKTKATLPQKAARDGAGRGFISIFFGSRENGEDSTDDEIQVSPKSGWKFLKLGRQADAAPLRPPVHRGAPTKSKQKSDAQPTRSHRVRERKDAKTPKSSMWKWS